MSINGKIIRTIIISVVILTLLGVVYFWVLNWQPEKEEKMQFIEKTEIFSIAPEEISKVEFKNSSGKFTLSRTGVGDDVVWTIPEKSSVKFSQEKLASAVFAFSEIYAEKEIGENIENLEDFGLDGEGTITTIYGKDGLECSFILGNKVLVDSTYYFMKKGSTKVWTVSKYMADNMQKSYDDFRETYLGSIDITNIDEFTLSKSGKKMMTIKRNQDIGTSSEFITSDMKMTYPFDEQVRIDLFEEMFGVFQGDIEVIDFISDDMSKTSEYGLDGGYKIEIKANKSINTLTLGNMSEDGNVYALFGGKNFIFTMDAKAMLDAVKNVKPFDLVQKFAHIYNIDNIESVKVSSEGKTNVLLIERDGDKKTYSINEKKVTDADFKKVFQSIIGLSWTGVLEDESKVKNKVSEIIFKLKDGKTEKATYREYDERNFVVIKPDGKKYIILKKYVQDMLEIIEKY